MTPDLIVTDQLADSRRLFEVLWSVVGCEVPAGVHQRLTGALDLAGEPDTRAEETRRRLNFAIHVLDGIEAAYYHRDRIEEIERGIVRELRAASTGTAWKYGRSPRACRALITNGSPT